MRTLPSRSMVLILFGAAFFIYALMLSVTIPALRNFSGGIEIFDLNPQAFQMGEATSLLDSLGEGGRSYYLWRQIPLDFLYPGLMGAALSSGIVALRNYAGWKHRFFHVLPLAPMIAAGLDYLENIHVIVLLTTYPDLSSFVCSSGFFVGIAKSLFYVISITAFFICLGSCAVIYLKRRAQR